MESINEQRNFFNLCNYTKSTIIESYNCGGAELRDFKNPKKKIQN